MEREVSTPWLGIQQMNECSHRALTIIASGYGSELSEALLQSPMIVEEEKSETRASNGVELPYGKFSFLFFFFGNILSPITLLRPPTYFRNWHNHITCTTFLNIWFRVAFGSGFVIFFTSCFHLLMLITLQHYRDPSTKSSTVRKIKNYNDYGRLWKYMRCLYVADNVLIDNFCGLSAIIFFGFNFPTALYVDAGCPQATYQCFTISRWLVACKSRK